MVSRGNSRPNNWKARGLSSGLCPCGWKSMEGGVGARLPMTFQTSANRAPSEPIYLSETQCLLQFLSLPWPLRVPAVLMVSTYLLFNFPVQKLCEPRFFLEPQLLPLHSPCCQAPARGKAVAGGGAVLPATNVWKTEWRECPAFLF